MCTFPTHTCGQTIIKSSMKFAQLQPQTVSGNAKHQSQKNHLRWPSLRQIVESKGENVCFQEMKSSTTEFSLHHRILSARRSGIFDGFFSTDLNMLKIPVSRMQKSSRCFFQVGEERATPPQNLFLPITGGILNLLKHGTSLDDQLTERE